MTSVTHRKSTTYGTFSLDVPEDVIMKEKLNAGTIARITHTVRGILQKPKPAKN